MKRKLNNISFHTRLKTLFTGLCVCLFALTPIFGQNAEQHPRTDPYPKLTYTFSTPSLQPDQLAAFEARAFQKATDFFELLMLIDDYEVDQEMRAQAVEMAKDMFWAADNATYKWIRSDAQESSMPIGQMLDDMLKKPSGLGNYKQMDHIELARPLERVEEAQYRGELRLQLRGAFNPDEVRMRFWVIRAEKTFGLQSKKIWKILLGEIK